MLETLKRYIVKALVREAVAMPIALSRFPPSTIPDSRFNPSTL
jgi:hypothetical protein